MALIGLVGFIGSGKGSVGDLLDHVHNFTQDSFAAPLKDAVATIFGWNRQLLEGITKESRDWREKPAAFWSKAFDKPFTPRLALQLMGTEAGRNVFHQDIWVTSLLNRYSQRGGDTVITDVRFKNEFQAVQKADGIIVRVRRGEDPEWFHTAFCANKGNTAAIEEMKGLGIHQSEWDWIGLPVNHTIYNDGSLADLEDHVRHLVQNQNVFLTSL